MQHCYKCLAILCLLSVQGAFAQMPWQNLLADEQLTPFRQLGGTAEYRLENGELIGTSQSNTPNSFLATRTTYDDFILEFEVWITPGLNSGVQFRSLSLPTYYDGRVHGYQAEIETSERRWAGGIYDESRRGWLYPLTRNPLGQAAFRNGEWNHYRIEAIGHHIRVWVNGQMTTRLVDDLTAEGFIAFQVHSIYDPAQAGKQVRWRNVKLLTQDLAKARQPVDPSVPEISYLTNRLTEYEKRTGWRMLWDGRTTDGWRGAKLDRFPDKGWIINNGMLTVEASDDSESGTGGDIITNELFGNFELMLDFKLTAGANSGIKYYVNPKMHAEKDTVVGLEFQLLDDAKHPDARKGVAGNRTLGSLYDLIPAENLSEPGNPHIRFNGVGQWNRAHIISRDGWVEHWLNGVKVVAYDRYSQLFRALVSKSKYEEWPKFGQHPVGHILLQDHRDRVHFRNVKVREW